MNTDNRGQFFAIAQEHYLGDWLRLEERIGKASKRAVKLGLEPLAVVLGPIEERQHFISVPDHVATTITGRPEYKRVPIMRRYRTAIISGTMPFIPGGWRLACVVSPVPSGELIMKAVPGFPQPAIYTPSLVCEHCHKSRRRNESFLLVNSDGVYKQIGRNCLRDFLGSDPGNLFNYVSELDNLLGEPLESEPLEEDHYRERCRLHAVDILEYLGWCAALIRNVGYVNRQKAEATDSITTGAEAFNLAANPKSRKEVKPEFIPTEADNELAKRALLWARELRGPSDYLRSLGAVARGEYVTPKETGFAGSIIVAYRKATEPEQPKPEQHTSEHIGTVGQRIEIAGVKVHKAIPYQSMYGSGTMFVLSDQNGNGLKWATTSNVDLEQGDTVDLVATIKGHDIYQGRKQTTLTRAKVTRVGS